MVPLWALALVVVVGVGVVPSSFGDDAPRSLKADLLIVGGGESACAAAVQASRLGVNRIVLVNDIDWLGGQFSAEGVGCLDEWTTVRGKRVNFPRSGLFLEVVERIRAHHRARYGVASPGNAYCGTETIEPAAAARIFEDLTRPHVESGHLRIERGWQPLRVETADQGVTGVVFEPTDGGAGRLHVHARLTIDASDWGDVIRLGGAAYSAGPDLHARFDEPSAPRAFDEVGPREMNPISWCVVLREAGRDATIPRPSTYDPRSFAALDRTPPWVDSDMSAGIYAPSGWSVYTHRRLVDRHHLGLPVGTEAVLLNWPVQDYPLCQLPQRVVEALEATEPGASTRNVATLSPIQRRIIFDDAKRHALGTLYHLQTQVHDRVGDFPQSFRSMKLTDEFGTADQLPPKPYVREGLRLEALRMLTERDVRAASREPRWATFMPDDGLFGFQFNIDFHPTRREFLGPDRDGPWRNVHTPERDWHTDTDRAIFPLRGLVPVAMDGLLGAGKNIGVSSIVQSALRLHGQMMLVGQTSATLAATCLAEGRSPRAVAADGRLVRRIQSTLARGVAGPGVLIWPYHDLPPDHPAFASASLFSVAGLWRADPNSVFFQPGQPVSKEEWQATIARAPAKDRHTLSAVHPATRSEAVRLLDEVVDFTALPLGKDNGPPRTDDQAIAVVTGTPGLVAFWTFGEESGQPRLSVGTREKHPLTEVGGPIARVVGGAFSGHSVELNGQQYFRIPYDETKDLNIAGAEAQVSMFAVVWVEDLKRGRTIAGMWSEGKGAHDDSGTRQYALLMNMPTYGGPNQLTPHVSSEGGVTRRADGSAFPWCADYAATRREVPTATWCSLGFTYDSRYVRAYINGVLDERRLDPVADKRTDRYFTREGPDGGDRGMNPYFHGRGIFRYDPEKHAATKPGGGSDFTVGARFAVGSYLGEATKGRFAGLAVFNRALSDAEMKRLHYAAKLGPEVGQRP